ncbi:MAG: VWA domain-containing protein, partial [Methanomicrobiales archaeon]|nr:VWA domain-containing protein [Methanomicrobiales archaeon]
GIATTTLFATKASGTANITVTAWAMIDTETWGYRNYSASKIFSQPIDHGTPNSFSTSYKTQIQVRTPTRISVLVSDAYGNPVDNRNIVEQVKFDASSMGLAGFLSGTSWVKSITVPVNVSGYADVIFQADPIGTNYVLISPPSPLKQKLLSIEGLSQSAPFSATSVATPGGTPYPYTTVKTGQFTIGFFFYDQYGYPTANQPVNISTNIAGETMSLVTNKAGMVIITYGPKDIAAVYTITARAANNLSVSASQKVEFVSGSAVDALLTASPQTMASRDVKDDITSDLVMRVMDSKGNPVQGETVTFRFKSFTVSGGLNQTKGPVLENGVASTDSTGVDIPAVSNENGEATATFHPGAFTTDIMAPGYSSQAQGSAVIEARWSTVVQQMTLRYINYPYLTIESWVNPTTVRVNETVDVTVKVSGDGWALQPKPIKVMLVTDRSGSMLNDNPDRAYSVMQAAKLFVDQMSTSHDSVGLVSFGFNGSISRPGVYSGMALSTINNAYIYPRSYSSYATLDAHLGTEFSTVKSTIDQTVPDGGTPTRLALKVAIDELAAYTTAKDPSVKAIILLSDGEYNWYGDPLATPAGSGSSTKLETDYDNLDKNYRIFSGVPSQNMSAYAKQYNITIYTIGFAAGITSGSRSSLTQIANGTVGGLYFPATAADIGGIYTQIAGALKDTAGVNTTMNLSFQNIVVNNVSVPGVQVYNYTYISGHSSQVDSWNATTAHFPGYPNTIDSTPQWNKDRNISFNIGTVRLGQVWQAVVTLQVLKEGNIKVFGASSSINTQGTSSQLLNIPDVYITALPNNSATALTGAANLQIKDLEVTNPGSKTSADLKWSLVYNGMYLISEDIMISPFGTDEWRHLPKHEVSNVTTSDTASVLIDSLPEGYYTIRVDADAYDANSETATLNIYLSDAGVRELNPGELPVPGVGAIPASKPYIKIS